MKKDKDIDKIFDAMDRIFDNAFYGGYMKKDDTPRKHNHRKYGNDEFDLFMDENKLYLTIELSGVTEKVLFVDVSEDDITIGANIDNRHYESTIKLPCKVIPSSIKKTFVNEILDIQLEKVNEV